MAEDAEVPPSFTFLNNTDRKVDIIQKIKIMLYKIKTLPPGEFFYVDTHATHPWLFFDSETQDQLVATSERVFLQNGLVTTYINITIPLYTLRERSLQVVRNNLSLPMHAFELKLPNSLQRELGAMVRERMIRRMYIN
jgi:hypothetical protein